MKRDAVLAALGVDPESSGVYAGGWLEGNGSLVASVDPTTEEVIGTVREADASDYEAAVTAAQAAFIEWRVIPAPERGHYVRLIGHALRDCT